MENTLQFFQEMVDKLLKDEKENPVAPYIDSKDVFNTLNLSLEEEPINEIKFQETLSKLVLSTPKTASNAFFNQLFGGRNEKAVLGDLLAVILNNSMYNYKAAGVQVAVEKAILDKVIQMIGWDTNAGGTIAPGGSMTNFMAMLLARDAKFPNIKTEGISQKMTIYTSIESHYSIPKNAAFSGIGRDNVRYIPVNDKEEMMP